MCTNGRRIAGATKHVSLRTVFEEITLFYSFFGKAYKLASVILKFDSEVRFLGEVRFIELQILKYDFSRLSNLEVR